MLRRRSTHHATPISLPDILLVRSANALWTMQTEKAAVELANNTLRVEEVIKEEVLAERPDISVED